jgi:hypothetical protein
MRAPLYAFLLAVWALSAGCLAAPTPEAWLAVGFRTPEQTFRTFQTGLRADLPNLEYRCLGSGFKRRQVREGVPFSLLLYQEFRRELFRTQWWLRYAASAKIKKVEELGPGRVRVEAEVDTWFHDERFAVVLVREDFYELWIGDKRVDDDLADWRELAREKDGTLVVSVPLPSGLTAIEIGELRAGREWKIDDFPLSAGDSP